MIIYATRDKKTVDMRGQHHKALNKKVLSMTRNSINSGFEENRRN
jgi:hypothetical protein